MLTYNHQDYIRQAIESVLMQKTSFPIKLIIGEDYSTDDTRLICNDLKEKFPDKIDLLPTSENLGMIANSIRTLKACTGKYIAMCEGDDYWTDPHKLQKQVDAMEQYPEISISFHPVITINGNTGEKIGVLGNINNTEKTFDAHELLDLGLNNMPTCSLLIRSSFIKTKWFSSFIKQHATSFFFKFLPSAHYGALYLNESMGTYRIETLGSHTQRTNNNPDLALSYCISVNKAFDKSNKLTNFKYDKEIQKIKTRRIITILNRNDLSTINKSKLYFKSLLRLNNYQKLIFMPILGKQFKRIINVVNSLRSKMIKIV